MFHRHLGENMFGSLFLIIEGSHIQKYHRPLPYTYRGGVFFFFYVHPYLGKIPILTNNFSNGLVQPPTSYDFHHAFITLHLARVIIKVTIHTLGRSQLTCELCCPGRCLDWNLGSISVEAKTSGSRKKIPRKSNHRNWGHGFMEPKYLVEDVIMHPNHHLTFGDWILREFNVFFRKDQWIWQGFISSTNSGVYLFAGHGKMSKKSRFFQLRLAAQDDWWCISSMKYVLYIVGDITTICLLKRVDVFFNSMYLFVAETF